MYTDNSTNVVCTAILSPKRKQGELAVTNIIEFTADPKKTQEIIDCIFVSDKFDFSTLLPLTVKTIRKCLIDKDWKEGLQEYWGTWGNAHSSSYTTRNGITRIQFETVFSPPFPVIAAFVRTFKVDVEQCYFSNSMCYWGIVQWKYHSMASDSFCFFRRKSNSADAEPFPTELNGYDPDDELPF